MLRSKLHQPWQPRVSDSPAFNPFVHPTEREVSFSTEIEEIEEMQVESPGESLAPTPVGGARATGDTESAPSIDPETPGKRWYASLIGRFAKS